MPRSARTLMTADLFTMLVPTSMTAQAPAQAPAKQPDFMVATMQMGSQHIRRCSPSRRTPCRKRTMLSSRRPKCAASRSSCDRAFAAMNDEQNTRVMRPFRRAQLPALAVLNFRNYHTLLHWGNAITYMRLRGKVPPTA